MKSAPHVPTELRPTSSVDGLVSDADRAQLRQVGGHARLRDYLAEMWAFREFAAVLPLGQVAAQTRHTVLGSLWNLMNPLLLVAVYYFIFQVVLGIESRRGIDDYLPFLTVGVLSYNFTRASIQGGALVVVKNRAMLHSLSFPRALLPISGLVGQGVLHLWGVAAMLILLPLMGVRPTWQWLLFPLVLLLHAGLNLGFAFFASRFTFHFRDFERFLPYLLRIGFYGSGILIPIIPEFIANDLLRIILQANPIFMVVDLARQVLLGYPPQPLYALFSTLWVVGLVLFGFVYFRRAEDRYGLV